MPRLSCRLTLNGAAYAADPPTWMRPRSSGNHYQFRHIRLQESLIRSTQASNAQEERRARRMRTIALVGFAAVVAVASTALVVVSQAGRQTESTSVVASHVIDARWSGDSQTLTSAAQLTPTLFATQTWSGRSGQPIGRTIYASVWATDSSTGALAPSLGPSATSRGRSRFGIATGSACSTPARSPTWSSARRAGTGDVR